MYNIKYIHWYQCSIHYYPNVSININVSYTNVSYVFNVSYKNFNVGYININVFGLYPTLVTGYRREEIL